MQPLQTHIAMWLDDLCGFSCSIFSVSLLTSYSTEKCTQTVLWNPPSHTCFSHIMTKTFSLKQAPRMEYLGLCKKAVPGREEQGASGLEDLPQVAIDLCWLIRPDVLILVTSDSGQVVIRGISVFLADWNQWWLTVDKHTHWLLECFKANTSWMFEHVIISTLTILQRPNLVPKFHPTLHLMSTTAFCHGGHQPAQWLTAGQLMSQSQQDDICEWGERQRP